MYKVIGIFGSSLAISYASRVQAKEMVECHECHKKRLPKAKELPLYSSDDYTVEFCGSSIPLINEVSTVRKQIFQYASYMKAAQEYGNHIYETGVAHSQSALDQLKDEENKLQRALVISSGGLLGLLLARKGGFLKKVIYASLGTGVIFSAFYPDVSKEKLQIGWNSSKQMLNSAVKLGGYEPDKLTEEIQTKWESVTQAVKLEPVILKIKGLVKKDQQPKEKTISDSEISTSS